MNVSFANVTAQGAQAGSIDYARNWTMRNVRLNTKEPLKISNAQNVESPVWSEGTMPVHGAHGLLRSRPGPTAGKR